MKTIVLSCFPAVGKSYLYNNQENFNLKVLDSDSSNFSWLHRKRTEEELEQIKKDWEADWHLLSAEGYINLIKDELIKVRNPDFPNNYIEYIKENIGKVDVILVSSHESVRKALHDAGIEFLLVFPLFSLKNEWIGRCWVREKNGEQGFPLKVLDLNWDSWIESCLQDSAEKIIISAHDTYLSDYIDTIVKSYK